MLFEHLIYSTAIAIIAGMIHLKKTGVLLAGVLLAVTIPAFGLFQFDKNLKSSNLIANPGFENGSTKPDNWAFAKNNGNVPVWDTVSHSGTRSIKISNPGNAKINSGYPLSDEIIAKPLQNYTISAFVKSNGVSSGPTLRVEQYDANWKSLRQNTLEFDIGTKEWTQKQMYFQTFLNTTHVLFYAYIYDGYGTFYVDDVELYEEGTDQNIISNNGSEMDIENMTERAHIEPKHAEMKRFHGMARARYWGLPKVNVQFIITAIVVNVKRRANVIGSVCYLKTC
jgi:hypothetical protein